MHVLTFSTVNHRLTGETFSEYQRRRKRIQVHDAGVSRGTMYWDSPHFGTLNYAQTGLEKKVAGRGRRRRTGR